MLTPVTVRDAGFRYALLALLVLSALLLGGCGVVGTEFDLVVPLDGALDDQSTAADTGSLDGSSADVARDGTMGGDATADSTSLLPDTSTADEGGDASSDVASDGADAPADVVAETSGYVMPDGAADGGEAGHLLSFKLGGSVSGLAVGASVVLGDQGQAALTVTANGPFTFASPVPDGGSYAVSIVTQPTTPSQTCTITGASGVFSGANIMTVAVVCTTSTFPIEGTVSGLPAGATIVLDDNGGDALSLMANGAFMFATPVASGGTYAVTIAQEPDDSGASCTVSAASGTVTSSAVTTVVVNCTPGSFTVSGTVSGLGPGDSLVLQANGTDNLFLTNNGPFAFPTPLSGGASYAVTVQANPLVPIAQVCTVTMGTGTVTGPVENVAVKCVTSTYTIGGTLTNLAPGDTLVLQDNAGDNLALTANGPFTFPTKVPSGGAYNVTVLSSPSSPTLQVCSVTASTGTGMVSNAGITSVQVTCTTGFATTVPVAVSGALSCDTNSSNSGRKVAVDANYVIYAGMNCSGAIYIATSGNGGLSFSAPVAVPGLSNIVEFALEAGPSAGTVYIAALDGSEDLLFTSTTNGAVSFGAISTLGNTFESEEGVSLSHYGQNVYVAAESFASGEGVTVFANSSGGLGSFTSAFVPVDVVYFDVLADPSSGNVWVGCDNPEFNVFMSTNNGATFGAPTNPQGMSYYSDWAIGGGNIYNIGSYFGTGESPLVINVIPLAAPANSAVVAGLAQDVEYQDRAISADNSGNIYVVQQTSSGIVVQQATAGASSVSATRTISTGGDYPGIVAGPNRSAVIVYTNGSTVYADVQAF